MANQFDLTRALEQLQGEIQKETGELKAKQTAITALDAEKTKLENEKQIDLAKKNAMEKELPILVSEINKNTKRILDISREKPKLEEEVRKKTADLNTKDQELRKHQESLRNALVKPK